mmetsp:Transcript_13843/g.19218  ORF Transcript_13843/g.19218 Transcript_13843/m.19218 type:complete len:202 (+) Transcript_13843:688-1293(+)
MDTEDQISKAMRLVKSTHQMLSTDDKQLLKDLTNQFQHFFQNFQCANEPTTNNHEIMLSNSLAYLTNLRDDGGRNQQNNTVNNTIEVKFVDGKKQYFLEGQPIQFKVFKNKQKNGDFRERWNRKYDEVKKYKKNNGHMDITRSTPGYEELGNWIAEQRRKVKRGKITLEQFESLTELGFEWDRSHYFHRSFQKKRKKCSIN